MSLKIKASDFVTARHLAVDSGGVEYKETMGFGGARRFPFASIDCVLLSTEGVLSFQVGTEVFKIPTKKGDRGHQEVIDTLVKAVKASAI
jgi:hypothetical protein